MTKSPHLSRRDFVTATTAVLGTIMGVVVGLPVIGYVLSPALKSKESENWIPVGPLENYEIGVPKLFSFTRTTINGWERTVNSYGVYVLRETEDENDILVLSNICTHLSCRVTWKEELQAYPCPCHDAKFDIQGKLINGPPPRPLDRYENKVEDGILSILFVEG